jgi:type II secretory pathway component PulM
MNSHEAFYVHVQGEQKGPYTIRHLDHLLNSGLIPVETLYWTEGMENWLPVTDLVQYRHKPRNWKKLIAFGVFLLVLGAFVAFFGPTIADGWRERTQREYTEDGAYWSARDAVRSAGVPEGAAVQFSPQQNARVALVEKTGADVRLRGEIISDKGVNPATWSVKLSFNALRSEWSASEVKLVPE